MMILLLILMLILHRRNLYLPLLQVDLIVQTQPNLPLLKVKLKVKWMKIIVRNLYLPLLQGVQTQPNLPLLKIKVKLKFK